MSMSGILACRVVSALTMFSCTGSQELGRTGVQQGGHGASLGVADILLDMGATKQWADDNGAIKEETGRRSHDNTMCHWR